ncbi:MAG: HAD family hydrolase, partial [Planctomycetes bacterium]|nr:HAD family hydrolase [Planctomycetota bacterium]
LMVGDMDPDIQMAKAADIKSAYCRFGFGEKNPGADYEIESFNELLNIIGA